MFSLQAYLDTYSPKNGRFFTIAIDGRGGSGKTTLAKYVARKYPDIFVLFGDDYWEPIVDPVSLGDFNTERFITEVVEPLQTTNTFQHRSYDFPNKRLVDHGEIVIEKAFCLERIYAFRFDLDWDLKIYVETPAKVCFGRGLKRDLPNNANAAADWRKWQAAEDTYRQRTHPLESADVVLDGTKPFDAQIT